MNQRRKVGNDRYIVEGEIENPGGETRRTHPLQIHKLREVLDLADLVVVELQLLKIHQVIHVLYLVDQIGSQHHALQIRVIPIAYRKLRQVVNSVNACDFASLCAHVKQLLILKQTMQSEPSYPDRALPHRQV